MSLWNEFMMDQTTSMKKINEIKNLDFKQVWYIFSSVCGSFFPTLPIIVYIFGLKTHTPMLRRHL